MAINQLCLLGGGTTLIGDPSGKDATRKILDQNEINNNIQSIKKVFNKILDTSKKKQNLFLLIMLSGLQN